MKQTLARFRRWLRSDYDLVALRVVRDHDAKVSPNVPIQAFIGIGRNAVLWATIEHMLDLLIFWHAFTRYGDDRDEHPRNLSRKLEYLRLKMERDETLSDDKAELRATRLSLAEMSERRHDYTHSLAKIDSSAASWDFSRLIYEGKHIRASTKEYGVADVQQLTRDIGAEITRFAPLVQRLCGDWVKSNRSLFTSSSGEQPRP